MTDQAETNLIPFPQSDESTVLTHFDRARQELELASSIDEVKKIRDQAEALRQYARRQKLSLEMQKDVLKSRFEPREEQGIFSSAWRRIPAVNLNTDPTPATMVHLAFPRDNRSMNHDRLEQRCR